MNVPVNPPPPTTEPGPGGVALLVEDDDSVRGLTARLLAMRGFAVLAADTPEEALRLAAGHPGRLDVLVTDVLLPEMDGRELARRVRALRPGVRVVFMSGQPPDEERPDEDGTAFLSKPFTPAQFAAVLDQVSE